jgi:hypothetical protein
MTFFHNIVCLLTNQLVRSGFWVTRPCAVVGFDFAQSLNVGTSAEDHANVVIAALAG